MMLSKDDLLGQLHVSYTNESSIEGYFKTIVHLADICYKDEFSEMISGYYLNASKIQGSARLSYFVNSKKTDSESNLIDFLRKNGVSICNIGLAPSSIEITKAYKWSQKKELKLRRFLVDYTMIGLELMARNLHHSRCLMAIYRFQVRLASLDIGDHFMKSFELLSPAFNSWSNKNRKQFLSALAEWPLQTQVDWAHFMVNLILPYDFNIYPRDSGCSRFPNPFSIAEINHRVNKFGLQIEEGWTPNAIS